MKRTKAMVAIMLAAALTISVTGCGGGQQAAETTAAAPAETTAAETTAAAAQETQAEKTMAEKPTYVLRFGHALTEQDAAHKYMLQWADAVYEKTNGEVQIEIYSNSQLGTEEDVIEQIRQGANMGWQTDFARLGSYVNGLSVVNAAYFVETVDEAVKLKDSPTIQALNEELYNNFNIYNVSFTWMQGPRHIFTNKLAKNPSELSGQLIRTAPAPIWVESINSLRCTATALSYGEIYTGIQTGVVDGCELSWAAALNLKINEVCKYALETGHIFLINTMIISKDWMDALPEEYRQIVIDECNAAGMGETQELADQTATSRQAMIDAGITVVTPEELDMAAFKEASNQAYENLGLTEVREAVYKDIGKN